MKRHVSTVWLRSSIALALLLVAPVAFADETPAEPAEMPPASPKRETKPPAAVASRIDGGYATREVVSLPLTGASVGLALGAQINSHVAIWGAPRLFVGSTASGLDVRALTVGPDLEIIALERLRFGFAPQLLFVGVNRATRDQTIMSWGPGMSASARFDVVQDDAFALFIRGAIETSLVVDNGSVFWGPSFGGGFDFDLHGSRAAFRSAASGVTSRTGSVAARAP